MKYASSGLNQSLIWYLQRQKNFIDYKKFSFNPPNKPQHKEPNGSTFQNFLIWHHVFYFPEQTITEQERLLKLISLE